MRDSGGHGGSSHPETNIPLIIIGQKCTQTLHSHRQIDITPTLSTLLGQPIPASSIGALIPELLDELPSENQLFAYYYNGMHLLMKLMKENDEHQIKSEELYKQFMKAANEHKQFLISLETNNESKNRNSFKRAKLFYISSTKKMSERLSSSYITYDDYSISFGLIVLITVRR